MYFVWRLFFFFVVVVSAAERKTCKEKKHVGTAPEHNCTQAVETFGKKAIEEMHVYSYVLNMSTDAFNDAHHVEYPVMFEKENVEVINGFRQVSVIATVTVRWA